MASSATTHKYSALVMGVRMSDYGYWVVTFSVAPGVYLSVMVCQTGISPERAAELAGATLGSQTGQKVAQ